MICGPEDIEKVLRLVEKHDSTSGWDLREVFSSVLRNDRVRILMPTDDSLVLFIDFNGKEWDGHFIGNRDTSWKAIKWMFEHEDCEAITWLPTTLALKRLAKMTDKHIGSFMVGDRHRIERGQICHQ